MKWGGGGEVLVKGSSGREKMDVEEWALMFFNTQDLAEFRATCKLEKKKSSDPEFNKLDFSVLNMTNHKESRSGAKVV